MQDGKLTVTVKIQVPRCCRSLHALCSARVLHVTYSALQSDLWGSCKSSSMLQGIQQQQLLSQDMTRALSSISCHNCCSSSG